MDILEEAKETYLNEMAELLQEIESSLLELEQRPDDSAQIHSLFRYFHTIKGSSEIFGFHHISGFAHTTEHLLDKVRNGDIQVSVPMIRALLDSRDHLTALLEITPDVFDSSDELKQTGEQLTHTLLQFFSPDTTGVAGNVSSKKESSSTRENSSSKEKPPGEKLWKIQISFKRDLFRHGMDPYPFIRYMRTMGTIEDVVLNTDDFPSLTKMEPESCYLDLEIQFRTVQSEKEIRDNFEFVQDDCTLSIEPMEEQTAETIVPEESGQPVSGAPAGEKKEKASSAAIRKSDTFRVDSSRIDSLINLVGELVISGARVGQLIGGTRSVEVGEETDRLNRIINEIRDDTMRLRMVPIGGIFVRFNRVVHDLSQEMGKRVILEVHGKEAELDKTVIEKITDPLTHIIRNALDHGIEKSEERVKNGKPAEGHIKLDAYHEGGEVVIEVKDDGQGLNRHRIHRRAVERGLVDENTVLSDNEIFRLIFEPGFSTAEKVSHVSGRGVGLDVVKKNIESLRGSVEIESVDGEGSLFRIRLPLTLATIDGFLVKVGLVYYVINLDVVEECVEFTRDLKSSGQRNFVNLKGEVLPFLNLKAFFNESGESSDREHIVVVKSGRKKVGLLVDGLMGEIHSVMKPPGRIFEKIKILSGFTILGNGEIAQVLDVSMLLHKAEHMEALRTGGEGYAEESGTGVIRSAVGVV